MPSDEYFTMLSQSCTWRTKSQAASGWRRRWKQERSVRRLFGPTFARSQQENTEAVRTWLSADFPVRTSATPASRPVSAATAPACSSDWLTPLALWDAATCSWRTSQLSLLETTSAPFLGSLPASALMLGGAVYARPTLAHLTAAIGGGVSPGTASNWPTARAEERQQHNSQDDYQSLSLAVKNWPTHTAKSEAQVYGEDGATGTTLPGAALRWQTPSVADTMGGRMSRSGERSDEPLLKGQAERVMRSLSGPHAQPIAGRGTPFSLGGRILRPQLSALFVEWLMGVKLGATCVCATEVIASEDSAMQLSRRKPRRRSERSGGTPSASTRSEVTA